MKDKRRLPRLDKRWRVTCCVLEKELKEHLFDSFFLYFMMNICGGGIAFLSKKQVKPSSMVVLDLESYLCPSAIIAIGEVVSCERVYENKGEQYEISVEYWWVGWRDSNIQNGLADFVISSLDSSETRTERNA